MKKSIFDLSESELKRLENEARLQFANILKLNGDMATVWDKYALEGQTDLVNLFIIGYLAGATS